MIGAIVYRLRALNTARLPVVHGNLLHGLLFRRLQSYSPTLSAFVHDELNVKPFTTSQLQWGIKRPVKKGGYNLIEPGTICFWRVTVLQEFLLSPLLKWEEGSVIRIGVAEFLMEKIMMDPIENEESGILSENDLIETCFQISEIRNITFHFKSPVSFRYFHDDLPLPRPEFIFSSIADKWNQAEMPLLIEKETIKEIAQKCKLIQWEGKSIKTFFSPQHGVNGFTGKYTFDVSHLANQERQVLLLLAQFSVFSGVGRLTGQGMGQSRVTYR